jgi:hypothetical protein
MPSLSRRIFLRNASIGVVATGAAAAGGLGFLTDPADAATSRHAAAAETPELPLLEGTGVVAHVVDAKTGEIALYYGTTHVSYQDPALAQKLLRAVR